MINKAEFFVKTQKYYTKDEVDALLETAGNISFEDTDDTTEYEDLFITE